MNKFLFIYKCTLVTCILDLISRMTVQTADDDLITTARYSLSLDNSLVAFTQYIHGLAKNDRAVLCSVPGPSSNITQN